MTTEILLIDDDQEELEIFSLALQSIDRSLHCILARNLEEADDLLQTFTPSSIFIDFNMPKTNGLECIRELRKHESLQDVRIILYSNHIDDDMVSKALALGAYRCIKKPNMTSVLARKLKEILQSRP